MASIRASLPHKNRTVKEPRQNEIHPVVLSEIEQVNHDIKVFKLSILNKEKGVKFHPGQWLDVLIPGLPKAGGFTLTSTPSQAQLSPTNKTPYLELAVQKSENPPAKWLWQSPSHILNSQLLVRVGGSFIWPPADIEESEIEKVIFVAGGVGINPLISMLTHISQTKTPQTTLPKIHFLYSVKQPPSNQTTNNKTTTNKILFLPRLQQLTSKHPSQITLTLFLTGPIHQELEANNPNPTENENENNNSSTLNPSTPTIQTGRIPKSALQSALGINTPSPSLQKTTCFICGPPQMTDEIVAYLQEQGARVYCEKWW